MTGTTRFCAGLAVALALAALLSGCGRKGPLDPPPASSQYRQPAPAPAGPGALAPAAPPAQQEFDEDGRPIAPTGRKKHHFLDFLLD